METMCAGKNDATSGAHRCVLSQIEMKLYLCRTATRHPWANMHRNVNYTKCIVISFASSAIHRYACRR